MKPLKKDLPFEEKPLPAVLPAFLSLLLPFPFPLAVSTACSGAPAPAVFKTTSPFGDVDTVGCFATVAPPPPPLPPDPLTTPVPPPPNQVDSPPWPNELKREVFEGDEAALDGAVPSVEGGAWDKFDVLVGEGGGEKRG